MLNQEPDGVPLPVYARFEHTCGKVVWLKYSRIDPTAYTEEEFLRLHDVDEESKKITEKKGGG